VQQGVQRFANDRNTVGSFAQKAGQLYDAAFASIPDQVVTTPETTKTLGEILNRVKAPALADAIKSPKVSQLADALASDTGQVTFNDLRELRTWVRQAKGTPELRASIGDADLSRLEGALSHDIGGNAQALGGQGAASKLARADQFYRAGMQRINNALDAFDSAGGAQPGESTYRRIIQAAQSGAGADAKKLVALKRSLSPDEWGDVAANAVNELGRPTKGATGAVGGDGFSLSQFMSHYNAMSERGRDVLFGSVGGGGQKATNLRANLDNLARVVDRLKAVEKGANASNTAVAGQAVAMSAGVMTSLPVTAKVLGGMTLTGEALTNPALVRWLAKAPAAAASQPAWQAHVATLATMATRNPAAARLLAQLNQQPSDRQK
ncbi:MAG TPA: hypothetical protein VFH92_11395, partial [Phenylobacterium sp.]|nr:hypothetical protein [Phenylobacterium sp.]